MKETRKQIIENARSEIRKKFSAEKNELKMQLKDAHAKYADALKTIWELKEQLAAEKEKAAKYEDWNERLQNFMELTPEERKAAFKEYATNEKLTSVLNKLARYSSLFLTA